MKTLWERFCWLAVVLSISMNVAFIAVWLFHAFPDLVSKDNQVAGKPIDFSMTSPLYRDLGLTPEQWKQIEPNDKAFREQVTLQNNAIRPLQEHMLELLAANPTDEAAIRATQEKIFAARNQLHGLVINHLLTVKKMLTPKQQRMMFTIIRTQCLSSSYPRTVYSPERGSPHSLK